MAIDHDKVFVEGAASDETRENRSGLRESDYEDIDLGLDLQGEPTSDPDLQTIFKKIGTDPNKLARAYKEAESSMHQATEERKRLERELNESRYRMDELIKQSMANTGPGGGNIPTTRGRQEDQYHYQPPFTAWEEYDSSNPDHVWWMANEAAARQREEGKREIRMELQQDEIKRRDDEFIASHPGVTSEEWRQVFQTMKIRGIRELEDGYEKVMGKSDNRQTRPSAGERQMRREVISQVADNLSRPAALRSSGGGGGTKTLTMDDLNSLTEEDFRKMPDSLRQKILAILPPAPERY